MTRAEHLAWAKERALEYVAAGDIPAAFSSLASDLQKHALLANHPGIMMGMGLLATGQINSSAQMTDFINGFN